MRDSHLLPAASDAQMPEFGDALLAHRNGTGAPNALVGLLGLLRGRYKLAATLVVLGGLVGSIVGYRSTQPLYQSEGSIQVRATVQKIMFDVEDKQTPMFDSFVETQAQFVQSSRVRDLAMQDPNWKKLGRGLSSQSIAEFARNLSVIHPRNTGLIQVRFADPDPTAAATAVTAVIKAYLNLFVNADNDAGRMEALERRRTDLDVQLKFKNDAIVAESRLLGADIEALPRIYDMKLEQVKKLEADLLDAEIAVAVAGSRQAGPTTQPAEDDLTLLTDPEILRLKRERNAAKRDIEILSAHYGAGHPEMTKSVATLKSIDSELAARTELLAQLRGSGGVRAAFPGTDTLMSLEDLRAREQRLRAIYERENANLVRLGTKSLEIRQYKMQADDLRTKLQQTDARIEALNLEDKNLGARITMSSEGDIPAEPFKDKRFERGAMGAVGLAGSLLGALMLVGLADRRLHRIVDAHAHVRDSSRVLGVIPEFDAQPMQLQTASTAAHCIHRIRALLQMRAQAGEHRALAVTSPSSGDGKTTVTIALGMSFAMSGTRTLLMDLDLVGAGLSTRLGTAVRRKLGKILTSDGSISGAQLTAALQAARASNERLGASMVRLGHITPRQLEVALERQTQASLGLSDVLAGDPLEDCVAATDVPNLFLLPVGGAAAADVSRLSPEVLNRIINEARRRFSAVLIDTGPILGSLEASMAAGPDVGVILAVSRGGDKQLVRRATELLAETNARLEGIIFNRANPQDMLHSEYSSYSTRASQSVRVRRAPRLLEAAQR